MSTKIKCRAVRGERAGASSAGWFARLVFAVGLAAVSTGGYGADLPADWTNRVMSIRWVAYSPPNSNPNRGIAAPVEDMRADLLALRKAHFNGVVTYGCAGRLGEPLVALLEQAGFQGMIAGLWDIASEQEFNAAARMASNSIVLGFCLGNEGYPGRYDLKKLGAAMQRLRQATGKPVSTTEEFDDYADEELLELGDWVFPNVHPYFHGKTEPARAVDWTVGAYQDLRRRTKKFVWLKEVGLPTAGDKEGKLTEKGQWDYYLALAKTEVRFVYFEGFDLPWKNHLPIEPHWGVFRADRTPKPLAMSLEAQKETVLPAARASKRAATKKSPAAPAAPFFVYSDYQSRSNHFTPSGHMGDCGDIGLDENCRTNPHSGTSCIKVVYRAQGKGPHTTPYTPSNWAGVYWQEPPDNWGKEKRPEGEGYNLSAYAKLRFWARADQECRIEFKVGGIDEQYGDSLTTARTRLATLHTEWEEFEIDLSDANLAHIIGGFCWTTSVQTNPHGATFYLDDVRFEAK